MIETLRNKLKSLALLDAIIEQEWQYRYFSYNSNWSASEEMGSLRDGCGGEWFLWLSGDSVGYKCFSPEDGIMPELESAKENAPAEYKAFISEPAFSMQQATCIWYLEGSEWVKFGKPVKYVFDLETILGWDAQDYQTWAIDYYERELNLDAIRKIFQGNFSKEIAEELNPDIDMNELLADLLEIGILS
jgi:hypothetical protein